MRLLELFIKTFIVKTKLKEKTTDFFEFKKLKIMIEKQISKESQNQIKTSIEKVTNTVEKDLKIIKENLSNVKVVDRWKDLN